MGYSHLFDHPGIQLLGYPHCWKPRLLKEMFNGSSCSKWHHRSPWLLFFFAARGIATFPQKMRSSSCDWDRLRDRRVDEKRDLRYKLYNDVYIYILLVLSLVDIRLFDLIHLIYLVSTDTAEINQQTLRMWTNKIWDEPKDQRLRFSQDGESV